MPIVGVSGSVSQRRPCVAAAKKWSENSDSSAKPTQANPAAAAASQMTPRVRHRVELKIALGRESGNRIMSCIDEATVEPSESAISFQNSALVVIYRFGNEL